MSQTSASSVFVLTSVLSIKDFMGFKDFETVLFGLAFTLPSVSDCSLKWWHDVKSLTIRSVGRLTEHGQFNYSPFVIAKHNK